MKRHVGFNCCNTELLVLCSVQLCITGFKLNSRRLGSMRHKRDELPHATETIGLSEIFFSFFRNLRPLLLSTTQISYKTGNFCCDLKFEDTMEMESCYY